MHEQLIFMLWVHDQLINLVTLELLLADLEKVIGLKVSIFQRNVPYTNMAARVAHE